MSPIQIGPGPAFLGPPIGWVMYVRTRPIGLVGDIHICPSHVNEAREHGAGRIDYFILTTAPPYES